MLKVNILKYCTPLFVYLLALISFNSNGINTWLAVIYAFVIIPLIELFLPPDAKNMEAAEEEIAKKNRLYDFILYIVVALQLPTLMYFLIQIQEPNLTLNDIIGRIATMGLLCGTFGINVGHELGHRNNRFEQFLAKCSLLTSLYMHFFIEHNKGHHKHVATPHDPSSAPYNQSVYRFWPRTISGTYLSAWRIANEEAIKKFGKAFTLHNEMIQFQLIQLVLVVFIGALAGFFVLICFLVAAFMGILLLETVNYIEHYGLSRKENEAGKYERAMPHHSWNSNHIIGRLMLFELSRHSDHHYLASRKYQILRHHENAPQMPTGYPGMMLLSLIPPLWFYIMNNKIKQLNYQH